MILNFNLLKFSDEVYRSLNGIFAEKALKIVGNFDSEQTVSESAKIATDFCIPQRELERRLSNSVIELSLACLSM